MAEEQGMAVRVTLSDIYNSQTEMAVTLAEIKATLALQAQQDRNDAALLQDHETRLRKIETRIYALPSIATLIALATAAYTLMNR